MTRSKDERELYCFQSKLFETLRAAYLAKDLQRDALRATPQAFLVFGNVAAKRWPFDLTAAVIRPPFRVRAIRWGIS